MVEVSHKHATQVAQVVHSQGHTVLRLPFDLEDCRVLKEEVSATLGKNIQPGKRDEKKVLSLFDDETERSYFPGLIAMVKKWGNKGWILNQKSPTQGHPGRMSFEDYTRIRTLLTESRLDGKKNEQKLQEIAEILEKWFPGIYECIDCLMCFMGGSNDQKRRLAKYQKIHTPQDSGTGKETLGKNSGGGTASLESDRCRRERDERWALQKSIFRKKVAEEQNTLRQRLESAFLKGEKAIAGDPRFGIIIRQINRRRQDYAIVKITPKDVQEIESLMVNLCLLPGRCAELVGEVDSTKKITNLIVTLVGGLFTGGK